MDGEGSVILTLYFCIPRKFLRDWNYTLDLAYFVTWSYQTSSLKLDPHHYRIQFYRSSHHTHLELEIPFALDNCRSPHYSSK